MVMILSCLEKTRHSIFDLRSVWFMNAFSKICDIIQDHEAS